MSHIPKSKLHTYIIQYLSVYGVLINKFFLYPYKPLPSCHMDRLPLFLVFLSLASIETYPYTRHKPYVLILNLAITKLPHGWTATIFCSIFELSTHKKPNPRHVISRMYSYYSWPHKLICSCYQAAIRIGRHYFW